MCKFCGNPECKADEMFDGSKDPKELLAELLGGLGGDDDSEGDGLMGMGDLFKKMLGGIDPDKAEQLRKIEEETHDLQDEQITDTRKFTSKVWRPEGKLPVYSCVDSATEVLEESLEALKVAQMTGDIPEDDENLNGFMSTLTKMKELMGEPVMSMSLTVSKSHTSIKVMKNEEVLSEMMFPNIKTAEDVLKLVAFSSEHFVDPILKDFEIIKEILES